MDSRARPYRGRRSREHRRDLLLPAGGLMSPFWIWMQVLIVIAVLAAAIIAITKLV
jgi:hypothetical protein